MAHVISAHEAVGLIPEGATIMIGGFMGCGTAPTIVKALSERGTGGLTIIANDAGLPISPRGEAYYGVSKLVHNRQIKKLVASHVGMTPEVAEQMNDGTLEVLLIPQGSLVEMIRAGGAGLGGILTPTGLGTVIEQAEHVHSIVEVDGKKYLLERPIKADFAIIHGYKVDTAGNVWYKGTTRNFNQVMATAADLVIAEAEHLVEPGEIEPENVMTQGILVDYIVKGGSA